jgi:hypothetical protein
MNNTWEGVYTNPFIVIIFVCDLKIYRADLKELIPEFYDTYSSNQETSNLLYSFSTSSTTSNSSPGDFLVFNSRDLDLSSIPDGHTVGDLNLPVYIFKILLLFTFTFESRMLILISNTKICLNFFFLIFNLLKLII